MPSILLVEDEFVVSMTLRVQLEAIGCEVIGTARSAEDGVQLARKLAKGLDLIITDIGLRGRSGVWLIREVRRLRGLRKTPILVVTAYGDDRVKEALDAGASLALMKPVGEESLAEAISTMLAPKRGRHGR